MVFTTKPEYTQAIVKVLGHVAWGSISPNSRFGNGFSGLQPRESTSRGPREEISQATYAQSDISGVPDMFGRPGA